MTEYNSFNKEVTYKDLKSRIYKEIYDKLDEDLSMEDLNLAAIITFNLHEQEEKDLIVRGNDKDRQ